MKRNPIPKIYEKLSAKEQAQLAFGHLLNGNETETESVIDSVAYKTYRCKDLDFVDHFESYKTMAFLWSIEYWQTYAMRLEAMLHSLAFLRQKDWENSDAEADRAVYLASCLSSLDHALTSVCDDHGLDHLAVRDMACAKPMSKIAPDEGYQRVAGQQLQDVIG